VYFNILQSAEALLPFMCYTHPNGKSSVLELSDVICWESEEHIIMVIFGVSMVAVMCSYWVFLLFLTCIAPAKSKDDDGTFFKTSRFLGHVMPGFFKIPDFFLENCHITVKCPRKYSSPFASKLLPPFLNDLQLQSPCVSAIFPSGGQNEARMDRMKQEWTKLPRYMEQKWRELDKTKHQGTKLSTNRQNEDK